LASVNSATFFDFFKVATAMFGYMTELSSIDIARTVEVTAEGIVTLDK